MDWLAVAGVVLLGAVLYRIRGGVTAFKPYIGDTLPRILFALLAGGITWLYTGQWFGASLVVLTTFGSEIIQNFSDEDMANIEKRIDIGVLAIGRALIMAFPLINYNVNAYANMALAGAVAGMLWSFWQWINKKFYKPPHTVGWPLQFIKIGDGYLIDGYWPMGEFTFGLLTCGTLAASLKGLI